MDHIQPYNVQFQRPANICGQGLFKEDLEATRELVKMVNAKMRQETYIKKKIAKASNVGVSKTCAL